MTQKILLEDAQLDLTLETGDRLVIKKSDLSPPINIEWGKAHVIFDCHARYIGKTKEEMRYVETGTSVEMGSEMAACPDSFAVLPYVHVPFDGAPVNALLPDDYKNITINSLLTRIICTHLQRIGS